MTKSKKKNAKKIEPSTLVKRKMNLDDDQVLIQKILGGSRFAFEELMKKYNKKIFGFIQRMVRDEEVAVELTQDFFIKIFRVLKKYNYQYKFTTWAYRICYNMVIDHMRKNQAQIDSLDDDAVTPKQLLESQNYIKEDGFEFLSRTELNEYIWKAVDAIPLKYRELILLRYLEGMKYEEIAEVVDIPVGTVKNRIFKAKEILKTEIEKYGLFK